MYLHVCVCVCRGVCALHLNRLYIHMYIYEHQNIHLASDVSRCVSFCVCVCTHCTLIDYIYIYDINICTYIYAYEHINVLPQTCRVSAVFVGLCAHIAP